MKVLLDATGLTNPHQVRGVGRYVSGLISGFESVLKDGSEIELLCLEQIRGNANNGSLPFPVIHNRRPSYPSIRLQWLWNNLFLTNEVAKTESFLYHSTDYNGIPISKKFKTVATLYDLIPLSFSDTYLRNKPLDIRLGYKSILRRYQRSDHIISISEATKKDAIQLLGISEDKITVVPLAFDKKLFHPPKDSDAVKKVKIKYNLPERYFLYSGSLEPHKNIERILKAFETLSNLPERFIFIGIHSEGQGELFSRQIGEFKLTERARHLGYVEDGNLSALHSGATAFVFPSLKEGFGLPALEAMACGCPVISSNLSAMPEVVGDAGILLDPYDEKALKESMVRLSSDKRSREQLREKGLKQASLFSWERCAQKTLEVYKKILQA